MFLEHRLIHRLASTFGIKDSATAKKIDRAAIVTAVNTKNAIIKSSNDQQVLVGKMNAAAQKLGRDVTFSREGVAGSRGTEIYGKTGNEQTGIKTFATGLTQNVTSEQKRSAQRMKEASATLEAVSGEENAARSNGTYDPVYFEQKRASAQAALDAENLRKDTVNAGNSIKEATGRAKITNPEKPVQTTARGSTVTKSSMPGSTMKDRILARGQSRAQRLGLEPPTPGTSPTTAGASPSTGTTSPTKTAPIQPGQSPVVVTPGAGSSTTHPVVTPRQSEAAGALNADSVDAPGSLAAITAEEKAAIDPTLQGLDASRDQFKIYAKSAQSAIDKRGIQIEDYKNNSIDRANQVAGAKIDQSKANRDLDLELINESRDRAIRDEHLAEEKTDRDYQREEDRIIGENTTRIEQLQTALGGRYGGFGSGKGLAKIQAARDEGTRVLQQLTEDKIYARQVEQNKISDIEQKWNESRQVIFNQHDQNVTAAYNTAMEAAQKIDDAALTEEGDQLDAGVTLAKNTFDALDKIWTKAGEALTGANQRALTRRDEVRKETYKNKQDALSNIFSGLATLPSDSPFFSTLEKAAGLVPGTIASTRSNEERRIAISEAGLRIQQSELSLQIQKFEKDGNKIDTDASKLMGHLVTSTGEVFRDYFGNPVNLVGPQGSVTSSIGNDTKLYGADTVGMNSTVNFSRYALQIGDLVPGSPYHKGGEHDIDGKSGDPIPAWLSGTVVAVNNDPAKGGGYGNYVDIYDGKNTTRYAHLQSVNVVQGQFIQGTNSGQPQILGLMGNTGNVLGMDGKKPGANDHETGSHLHFEVRAGNEADWTKAPIIDPMSVGMQPGLMHGGNIVWVDQMRKQMRQGAAIGQNRDGSTMTASNLDTPWQEVDQQILELAKNVFQEDKGGTDWKAVGLVYDYLNQNKMGDYQVSYTGQGAVQGSQQASKELAYSQATHGRNVTQDRQLISKGFIDPENFASSLTDGTLGSMNDAEMKQYMSDMGYVVEDGKLWGNSVREMDAQELQVLNQRRQSQGLPPLQ